MNKAQDQLVNMGIQPVESSKVVDKKD